MQRPSSSPSRRFASARAQLRGVPQAWQGGRRGRARGRRHRKPRARLPLAPRRVRDARLPRARRVSRARPALVRGARRSQRTGERTQQPRRRGVLGRHVGQAIELYERARALRQRLGDVTRVALAMNNLGELRSDQGRFEEAEQLLHEAQAHLRRGGPAAHRDRGSCKPGPSRCPRGTPRRGKGLAARGARGLRRDARGELGARDGDEARRGRRPARRSCRGSAGSGEHSPR